MGKNLIQQRRGKGSIFTTLKHQMKGAAKYPKNNDSCIVTDFTTSKTHTAPLMKVKFGKEERLLIAPEGVRIGEELHYGKRELKPGNVLTLQDLPEGTFIYNIELKPKDGGKIVRSSGTFAKVAQKTEKGISVILPSKRVKIFNGNCRATVGIVAGAGRKEKPLMKAGNNFKRLKARHKRYPIVCGISMNAVAHPFGGKGSHTKGRPTQASRHDPPGRKVGKIAPKRTGMKR